MRACGDATIGVVTPPRLFDDSCCCAEIVSAERCEWTCCVVCRLSPAGEVTFAASDDLPRYAQLLGVLAVVGGQQAVLTVGSAFTLPSGDAVYEVVSRPTPATVRYVGADGSGT